MLSSLGMTSDDERLRPLWSRAIEGSHSLHGRTPTGAQRVTWPSVFGDVGMQRPLRTRAGTDGDRRAHFRSAQLICPSDSTSG